MALKRCKECDKEISSKAKNCPHCGASQKKNSKLGWIFLIGMIFWFLGLRDNIPSTADSANKTISQNSIPTENNVSYYPTGWSYSRSQDDMTGKNIYFAIVASTNTLNFGFPYEGTQQAKLALRTHPRYGKDIVLEIERGQFLCDIVDGCRVLVRFDDAPSIHFQATEPADHSTTSLFLSNYSSFVEKMMKAKKVRILASFYQEGDQTLEFDVSNFDVKQYKPSN